VNFFSLISIQRSSTRLPFTSPQPSKASKVSRYYTSQWRYCCYGRLCVHNDRCIDFPKAGSNNEATNETGAALANKCLTFKSGSGLSTVLIMRNLEDDGAIPFARAGRTSATVGYTCAPIKLCA
jgi:hypothetical protein